MIITVTKAAKILGRADRTVRLACAKHGIGKLYGKMYLLNKSDIEKLRAVIQDGPGNPEFRKAKTA